MKSSGSSSARPLRPPSAGSLPEGDFGEASPRQSFALTGRSAVLDPRTNAVRGDLADVRLASLVFAPHYAAPLQCVATRAVSLHATRDPASATLTAIAAGDRFEVLELAGDNAWGTAPDHGLVGYVDRTALDVARDA